jgi:hypothetical protein
MNAKIRRANALALRLAPPPPTVDVEALRAMPFDELLSLYRERIEAAPKEDLSALSAHELATLYRERAGIASPRR